MDTSCKRTLRACLYKEKVFQVGGLPESSVTDRLYEKVCLWQPGQKLALLNFRRVLYA